MLQYNETFSLSYLHGTLRASADMGSTGCAAEPPDECDFSGSLARLVWPIYSLIIRAHM